LKSAKNVIVSPLIVKPGIAFFDQAMLSAVNFVVTIILIKSVSKVEYGYYSIAFSVSLFLVSIQNAIVTTPLTVLLTTKKGKYKQDYCSALCLGQFVIVLPLICTGLVIIMLLYSLGMDATKASVSGALCLAAAGILFREFLRSYFFAEESPFKVFKLDLYYTLAYLGLIGIAYLIFDVNGAAVFIIMGVSAFLISIIFNRGLRYSYNWKSIKESYSENWEFGKWALLGVFVTHIQHYSYLYLLGALSGSAAVADVSASRLLLMPFQLLQAGWGKTTMPRGSKLREKNQLKRFFNEQIMASLFITVALIFYVWLLLLGSDFLGSFLFTKKYEKSLNFIALWGVIFAMGNLALNASFGLQVAKEFHIITKVNIITMIITVCLAYFLIKHHEIEGGLVSLIIGETLLAFALWWFFRAKVFNNQKTT
jgi:O-antigen/teichoic acid export membrane protein